MTFSGIGRSSFHHLLDGACAGRDARRRAVWIGISVIGLSISACASKPPPPLATIAPTPPPIAPAPTARPAPPPVLPVAPRPPPAPIGPAPGSQRDFAENVGDRVYFDYDQFAIRPDAAQVLTAQAAWLNRYPAVQVRIEGNADERGTREYNLALGDRRASAIRDFLLAHGVTASRMTTISFGKEQPIDSGTGELAWSHNRNGHTAITGGAP